VAQRYEDFIIQVFNNPPGLPGQYVQVVRAPGQVLATNLIPIHLNVDKVQIELLAALQIDGPRLRQLGTQLFEQLFEPGEVRPLYFLARGGLAAKPGMALRIQVVPVEPGGSASLRGMPWEYLYNPLEASFVALEQAHNSVTRSFIRAGPCQELPLALPVTMLSVLANPAVGKRFQIDLEAERKLMLDAVQQAGLKAVVCHPKDPAASQPGVDLVITFLDQVPDDQGLTHKCSRQALKSYLTDPAVPFPHILHFGCHGSREDAPPFDGTLLLEKDPTSGKTQGDVDVLPARDLHQWLKQIVPNLRLVVLNACTTAPAAREVKDSHSLAEAVILAGVPAAVAMQFDIPLDTALAFTGGFYTALFKATLKEDLPIDQAMALARDAILALKPADCPHWGIPVLYRNPGGIEPFKLLRQGGKVQQVINLTSELNFLKSERDRLAQQAGGLPGWAQVTLQGYNQRIQQLQQQLEQLIN